MQRRAAALYAAFFILVAAASYAMIGVAQEPTVSLEDPDYSVGVGDAPTIGGTTYTVEAIGSGTNDEGSLRSADLSWVNDSARFEADLENGSTVPPADVQWDGQTARHNARLENGSTVSVSGTDYRVEIAGGDAPAEFALVAGDSSQTYAVGDSIAYRGEAATVTAITSDRVTVVWGDDYRVVVEDAADPSSFTLHQVFNVSARLAEDPAVEDQTVTRADGREYVVYRENGSTRPLDDYLPEPETRRLGEGALLLYRGNATTVESVTNESVTLVWSGARTNTLSLEEGATTTIGGTQYVAHLPDNSTLELASDVDAYDDEVATVDTFHERMNGFWGITIVSGLAAMLLLALAYLPSRY